MLLFFHGKECEHCQTMAPLITKLEAELGVQVERKETWHDEANAKLLIETYDPAGARCGGVPFFYNTETDKWLCGAVEYEALKNWASLGTSHGH